MEVKQADFYPKIYLFIEKHIFWYFKKIFDGSKIHSIGAGNPWATVQREVLARVNSISNISI